MILCPMSSEKSSNIAFGKALNFSCLISIVFEPFKDVKASGQTSDQVELLLSGLHLPDARAEWGGAPGIIAICARSVPTFFVIIVARVIFVFSVNYNCKIAIIWFTGWRIITSVSNKASGFGVNHFAEPDLFPFLFCWIECEVPLVGRYGK